MQRKCLLVTLRDGPRALQMLIFYQHTAEDSAKGQKLFRRAIELDPDFAVPHAALAFSLYSKRVYTWALVGVRHGRAPGDDHHSATGRVGHLRRPSSALEETRRAFGYGCALMSPRPNDPK